MIELFKKKQEIDIKELNEKIRRHQLENSALQSSLESAEHKKEHAE